MSFTRETPVQRRARRVKERRKNLRALAKPARHAASATMTGTTSGTPIAKEDASQSGPYMRAAKALGYCMRCGVKVEPLKGLLDFCHADICKGTQIKTDVRLGWPGCRACHEEVGRRLIKPVRRAVEYLLGVMTRAAILEAGTWPAKLERWMQ